MVRIELQIDLHYTVYDANGADFIFNIHAAHTTQQVVRVEQLVLSQPIPHDVATDPATAARYMRLHAEPGPLHVCYSATIDIDHYPADHDTLQEVPVRFLPLEAMQYIYPSRYCESDRLLKLAFNEFGQLWQGHGRVRAIEQWVQRHIAFTSNTSNGNTSAIDTLIARVGICRDFAHVMIALCRALNIPARMATGTDFGADPALGPPDFHAYVEVYLSGRWYLFDASGTGIPMGFVRIGTGRDAADVAFATIFGAVASQAPIVSTRIAQPSGDFVWPIHSEQALSTASA